MDSDTSDLEEIISNDSDSYDTDDESSFTINPNTIVHSDNIPDTSNGEIYYCAANIKLKTPDK